ncbi:MAG: DUF7557 family protein [Promethearchaeota archaeon]
MGEFTTIQIKKKLKKKLDQLKVSKRDTYNQVIEDLVEDTFELSEQAKNDLQEAVEDVKQGRVISHEDVKKELGI